MENLNKRSDKINFIVRSMDRDNQLKIAIEECSELIKAISKYQRYGDTENLIEETADVLIVCEQIMAYLNCREEVSTWVGEKLDRTVTKIKNGEIGGKR